MGFDGNSPITGYDIECKNKSGKLFTLPLTCLRLACPPAFLLVSSLYVHSSSAHKSKNAVSIWSVPCMSMSRFLSVPTFSPCLSDLAGPWPWPHWYWSCATGLPMGTNRNRLLSWSSTSLLTLNYRPGSPVPSFRLHHAGVCRTWHMTSLCRMRKGNLPSSDNGSTNTPWKCPRDRPGSTQPVHSQHIKLT